MQLVKEFDDFLKNNDINLKNNNIVVAVSCGVDSSVLLHVLEMVKDKYQFNIVVAHVNHKKREQSEEEERYIREYSNNRFALEVLHLDEIDDDFSSNFQEKARNARYDFFEKVLKKYNSKYLFLAHHLNDDMETMFFRLLRSGSLASISGMSSINKVNDYYICRPFLYIEKNDLYEYAKLNNVKYYEDESNNSDDYARNRIRHHIINEFYKENSNFKEAFLAFKEKISYSNKLLCEKRDELIKKYFEINKNIISFKINDYLKLDHTIRFEILFELLKNKQFSIVNIEEIDKIILSNKENCMNKYKDIFIFKEYEKVTIKNSEEEYDVNLVINECGLYHIDDDYDIEFREIDESEKNISNINIMCYNMNMFPFTIRNKVNGDKILLSKGHKKVNDYLTDNHICVSERKKVLVLLDKNDEIVSILRYKKSDILSKEANINLMIEIKEREK